MFPLLKLRPLDSMAFRDHDSHFKCLTWLTIDEEGVLVEDALKYLVLTLDGR